MHYLDSMKKKQSEDLVLTACLIQAGKVCCSADKHGFFIRHFISSFFFYFHECFVIQKMNLSSFYIKYRSVAKTFSMKLI